MEKLVENGWLQKIQKRTAYLEKSNLRKKTPEYGTNRRLTRQVVMGGGGGGAKAVAEKSRKSADATMNKAWRGKPNRNANAPTRPFNE